MVHTCAHCNDKRMSLLFLSFKACLLDEEACQSGCLNASSGSMQELHISKVKVLPYARLIGRACCYAESMQSVLTPS